MLEKIKQRIKEGKEISEQAKAEKMRKKHDRIKNMPEGSVRKIIYEGHAMNKKPLDVMRDEYRRRKNIRESKYVGDQDK